MEAHNVVLQGLYGVRSHAWPPPPPPPPARAPGAPWWSGPRALWNGDVGAWLAPDSYCPLGSPWQWYDARTDSCVEGRGDPSVTAAQRSLG